MIPTRDRPSPRYKLLRFRSTPARQAVDVSGRGPRSPRKRSPEAARFSLANQPNVPDADFITLLPVPALVDRQGAVPEPDGKVAPSNTEAKDFEPSAHLHPTGDKDSGFQLATSRADLFCLDRRLERLQARLRPSAERLKGAVNAKLRNAGDLSASSRMSIAEILKQTVLDPIDIWVDGPEVEKFCLNKAVLDRLKFSYASFLWRSSFVDR